MRVRRRAFGALAAALLASCGGGGGSGGGGSIAAPGASNALTAEDVRQAIAQAVGEAQARGVRAHVAVVDRVGNVLAVFSMSGAPATIAISGGGHGGLDGIPQGTIPATLAAVAKAVTGAYLSSQGNAFSTRTAGQIVQEHFDPQESQQPSGPLYGVQFSQLTCSDVVNASERVSPGPKRSPLGLAADPGGIPLYKAGVMVGGIGIEADGVYGFDRDITDRDTNVEELVAVAGGAFLRAPDDIRGERITADGRTFRYVDSEGLLADPARAPAFASLPGALVAVPGYTDATVRAGTAFGTAASGVMAAGAALAIDGAWILVDEGGANRFPPVGGGDGGLRSDEVRAVMSEGLAVARRARGQIRRPLGSFAQVTVAVVDTRGDILGLARTDDGPVFGIDVAVQKARTAMFFSHPAAESELLGAAPALYLPSGAFVALGPYAQALRDFTGRPLDGSVAWSARAIGNVHRPFFPDGIDFAPPGPLSTPIAAWSPFNVGFQLDLVSNQVLKGVLGDTSKGCAGRTAPGAATDREIAKLRNGAQIFPGGVPIYRGTQLVGAVGVSGDGVDQDDMVAYLGLANAAAALGTGLANAPPAMRADQLAPGGVRLRYVQCPQSPFNGSTEQNVCR